MSDAKRPHRPHEPLDDEDGRAGHDRLRALLRRGDPGGDGRAPTIPERAALRRLIIDAAGASSTAAHFPRPAIAAAVVAGVALALAALFWRGPDRLQDPSAGIAGHSVDRPVDGEAPPPIRNLQFVTRGGTRIVWVLNRNLDI